MGFNVNCQDCFYHTKTETGRDVCYHPRMIIFNNGSLWPIEDINQNIDCDYFEE